MSTPTLLNVSLPLKSFHIFIIGSASCPQVSNGQLPTVDNVLSFVKSHPDKQCYFYFIDPRHYDVMDDQKLLSSYQNV